MPLKPCLAEALRPPRCSAQFIRDPGIAFARFVDRHGQQEGHTIRNVF